MYRRSARHRSASPLVTAAGGPFCGETENVKATHMNANKATRLIDIIFSVS
jgi:hypothetical protein